MSSNYNINALTRLPNGESALPNGAILSCLAEQHCLVLGLIWPSDWRDFDSLGLWSIAKNHGQLTQGAAYTPYFRCVEVERLPYILAHGCDVDPTDTVFWVDKFPGKPMEYGGETKVLMVFDMRQMKSSGQEVKADIPPEELERLRSDYPTVLKTNDGQHLWLSRLPESDHRVGSGYEVEHGRWIPGDPWDALRLIIVLAHDASLLPNLTSAPFTGEMTDK